MTFYMPGRFLPPMALMNERLRRGELEIDGGLELEGDRERLQSSIIRPLPGSERF